MAFKFSQRSIERMNGIDSRLIAIAHRALELSKVDFGIPEFGGLRTTEQQNYLHTLGKSNCDGINDVSKHQRGVALDVYAYVDGAASWQMEHLTTVAAAMLQAASEQQVKLAWGGHWINFIDAPHFELV